MPQFTKHPKNFFPLTEEEFLKGMETGHFTTVEHKAYVALLYHTGVRKMEGLRAKKEQFQIQGKTLYFDVGPREKRGLHTKPLPIPLRKPYVNVIVQVINQAGSGERVFHFCPRTAYNAVDRVFTYPAYLRLSKITMLFRAGFSVDQVRSWTGHRRISSLEPYVGFANVEKMGEA